MERENQDDRKATRVKKQFCIYIIKISNSFKNCLIEKGKLKLINEYLQRMRVFISFESRINIII